MNSIRVTEDYQTHTVPPVINRPSSIYNHDIMNCTSEEVSGNYLYSGRALGLTEPGDVIQLHPDLEQDWVYITRHYDRIGLSYTRSVVWNTAYDVLAWYPEYEPSFFFYGEDVYESYLNHDFHNVVNRLNSKNRFMRIAAELQLPVPKTFCYSRSADIVNASVFPFPCYVKAAISVSGVGIYRCEDEVELFDVLHQFPDDTPVQVQEEVKATTFLNVQYQVTSQGVERFAITEQILDGFAHKGNRYPSRFDCYRLTDPYAEYLYERGMKGVFAFDVAVVAENGEVDYKLIECNPRFNGATYPAWIAKKLDITEWVAEAFSTRIRSLAYLRLNGLEYNPVTGIGIVLVNWGPIQAGKISAIFAGPEMVQEELRRELIKRL